MYSQNWLIRSCISVYLQVTVQVNRERVCWCYLSVFPLLLSCISDILKLIKHYTLSVASQLANEQATARAKHGDGRRHWPCSQWAPDVSWGVPCVLQTSRHHTDPTAVWLPQVHEVCNDSYSIVDGEPTLYCQGLWHRKLKTIKKYGECFKYKLAHEMSLEQRYLNNHSFTSI